MVNSLLLDWNRKDRAIPDLPLQILETYLSKDLENEIFDTGIDTEAAKKTMSKPKTKQLKPTTLLHYFGEEFIISSVKSKNKEADNEEVSKNWKNLLIWGDNLYILKALQKQFKSKIQLIYIDPPFYTGENEYIDIPLGLGRQTIKQMPGPIKEVAYQNIWSNINPTYSFSQWFYERVMLMRDLLKETGFIAVRFDYHYGHYAKAILDSILSESNFVCEFLVRRINKPVADSALEKQNHLICQTDSLFLYRKSQNAEYSGNITKVVRKDPDPLEIESPDDNIWIDITGYEKTKKTLYPTENSIVLLDRIIKLCSKPKDIVADFFCGSGTTVATAQNIERRWIGVDIGKYSINEIKKRILLNSNASTPPFQVLNLEMYRKHLLYLKMQTDLLIKESQKEYYKFILDKINASYIDGFDHVQGKLDDSYIHIGNIDTMVSALEIQAVIEEIKSKVQSKSKILILGWDYLMEVNFFRNLFQKEQGLDVELKIIPEQILHENNKEDIDFRDLPFLEFDKSIDPSTRKINITFREFQLNYPSEILKIGVGNGLELIDFWAIDWNYNEKALFRANNYSFRKIGAGRKITNLCETNIEHQYEKIGSYTVVLTIYDIFANETTEYFQIVFK